MKSVVGEDGHGIELSNVTWGAINGNEIIDRFIIYF